MLHASRILGTVVGSTNPAFLTVLAVHVLAALAALISGAAAALSSKGSARHVRLGRRYYQALGIVFVTATALAAMRLREDYYLFLIGALAFSAATIGYLHRRRRLPGDTPHITGMGLSYIAMLTAFYVDNGPHLPLWHRLPATAFWLLPTAAGAPILVRALRKSRPQRTPPTSSPDIDHDTSGARSRRPPAANSP